MIKKILKGEDVSNVKCKTRLDELLKRLATGESCSDIEGCTDVEKLVKKFNEDFNGGGGTEEITDLTGTTWKFNETVDTTILLVGHGDIYLNFTSNTNNYTVMMSSGFNITYGDTEIYTSDGWLTQAFRTIEITGGDEVADADVIAWLQANATQVN